MILEILQNLEIFDFFFKITKFSWKFSTKISKFSEYFPTRPPVQPTHSPQIVEIVDKVVGEVSDKSENVYFQNSISLGLQRREQLVQKKLQIRSKIHDSRKLLVEGFMPKSYTNGNAPIHHSPRASQV